jgi:hypothetical protein
MTTTTISANTRWSAEAPAQTHKTTIYNKFVAFTDSQTEHKTLWFMVSMIVQGIFFLPVPALLMFSYNAPAVVLIITLSLFFANVILGMGGAGVRTLLSVFAASILIHLLMLATFII